MIWTVEGIFRNSPRLAKQIGDSPRAAAAARALLGGLAAEVVELYADGVRAGRSWAASAPAEVPARLRTVRGLMSEAEWDAALGVGDAVRDEGLPRWLHGVLCAEEAGDAVAAATFWRRRVRAPWQARSWAFLSGFADGVLTPDLV
jgi:hypothetical protein